MTELTVPTWLEPLVAPGVVAGVLGWAGIRLVKRVDELEKGKAAVADLKELIAEIRADREAASKSREKLYQRVNDLAESVAFIRGGGGKGPPP